MRSIDSRLWSDGWVRKLNALDRYLFIYLLTNDHSTWCGVYELDLAMMAFESGIDREDLERSMLPRLSPKVIYVDGWVYIPNWMKYHLSSSGTVSPQHKKGFDSAWKAVPERIRAQIAEIEAYPIEGVSPSSSSIASSYRGTALPFDEVVVSENGEEREKKQPKYPNAKTVFSWFPFQEKSWALNTTELKHAELLFVRGEAAVCGILSFLANNKDHEFCPTVTKPSDLERKWNDIIKFADRNGL